MKHILEILERALLTLCLLAVLAPCGASCASRRSFVLKADQITRDLIDVTLIERMADGSFAPQLRLRAGASPEYGGVVSLEFLEDRRRITAVLDPSGLVSELAGRFEDGSLASTEHKDKELLAGLARQLKTEIDLNSPLAQGVGRIVGYIVEMAPLGVPLELRLTNEQRQSRQGANTASAQQPLVLPEPDYSQCWAMNGLTATLIGSAWVDKALAGDFNQWLARHLWKLESGQICGFRTTSICDRLGTIYPAQAGAGHISLETWPADFSTQPLDVMRPAVSNTTPIGFPAAGNFCPGRCGPGCLGEFHEDLHNFSPVSYTAECFAHDLCTGEAAQGKPNADIFVGEGYACVDEFLNASFGYMNGPACRTEESIADLVGWWRLQFGKKNRYIKISAKSVVDTKTSEIKGKKIGSLLVRTNSEGKRAMQILQTNVGYIFTTRTALFSSLIAARSSHPQVLDLIDGAATKDNKNVIPFSGGKYFYGGIVRDEDGALLEDVSVQILAFTPGGTLLARKLKTDSAGRFYAGSLIPYVKYGAKFALEDHASFKIQNVLPYMTQGKLHEVTLKKNEEKDCTYTVTSVELSPFAPVCPDIGTQPFAETRGIQIKTQSGCQYSATSDSTWLKFQDPLDLDANGQAKVKAELGGRAPKSASGNVTLNIPATAGENLACVGRTGRFTVYGGNAVIGTYEVSQQPCC